MTNDNIDITCGWCNKLVIQLYHVQDFNLVDGQTIIVCSDCKKKLAVKKEYQKK